MKILELFAGTRSIGRAFEKHGHEVTSILVPIENQEDENNFNAWLEELGYGEDDFL